MVVKGGDDEINAVLSLDNFLMRAGRAPGPGPGPGRHQDHAPVRGRLRPRECRQEIQIDNGINQNATQKYL